MPVDSLECFTWRDVLNTVFHLRLQHQQRLVSPGVKVEMQPLCVEGHGAPKAFINIPKRRLHKYQASLASASLNILLLKTISKKNI